MYIKELIIENFKSFVGRHRIPFQMGFTGITGLNGSGKSNIVDAIQFVLGTRSSKVIRAKRLSELIFNGGKKGKPASFCTVSVVFDNKERMLPIDADTVTFTKKVKISTTSQMGYSVYYYLNGRASSNGEFEKVLAEAGIYPDAYYIVKQGDITDIVRIGGVERRKILERAEKIDVYDKHIEKSREECKQIDENLDRMRFILSEKENSLREVEKEKEKALKYKRLGEEKNILEAKIYKKMMLEVKAKIEHLRQQITKLIEESREVEAKKEEKEEKLRKVQEGLEEIDRQIMEVGGKEAEVLKQKIDEIKLKIVALKENNKNDEIKIQDSKTEIKRCRENLSSLLKSRELVVKEHQEMVTKLSEVREEIKAKEERLKEVNEKIGKKDKKSLEIQREIAHLKKKLDELSENLHNLKMEHDRLSEKRERVEEEIQELNENYENTKFQISDAEMAIKDIKLRVGSQKETKKELERTLYDLRNKLMEYKKDLHDIDVKIRSLEREKTRLEAEKELSKQIGDGVYKPAVQAILQARDKGILKGIYGTPLELGRVEERYRLAIEVAAGKDLSAVIVENDEVGEKAIMFLKKHKFGRAKFLPLNMRVLRPKATASMLIGQPGVIDFAVNLIDFDEKFYPAFAYICKGTLIVKDLSYARNFMGKGVRLVTLDGELIDPLGAMTGGYINKEKSKVIFNTSSRSLKEVEEELQHLKTIERNLNIQIERTIEDINEIERDLGEYKANIDINEIKDLETRRNHYLSRKKALEVKLEEKINELKKIEKKIEEIEKELEKGNIRKENIKKDIKENAELLERTAEKKLADELKTLREEISAKKEVERDLISKIEVNKTQRTLAQERIKEMEEDIHSLEEAIKKAKEEIKKRKEKIEHLEAEEKTLVEMEFQISKELESFREKKNKLIKEETHLQHTIEGLNSKKNTLRELIQDTKFKIPQLEENYKEYEKEYNALGIIVEGELETLDYLKRKMRETERKMRELEPVNMMALTQYQEIKERIEKIEKEIEEAEEEKNTLLKLIDETIEKKRRRFEKVFNAVNEKFKEIYHHLSGGEGELILENPENPTESGLEIKAAPKGKNPLRIDSLSGGEKSLTAIAFILAVQNYAPSPFIVMDEADMFLDAANSRNIASTIRRYTNRNQFIMISLKEVVLSQADYFYGVSIYEDKGSTEVYTFISKEKALEIARKAEEEKKKKLKEKLPLIST